MKKILPVVAAVTAILIGGVLVFGPLTARAAPVSWDGNTGTNILQPLQAFWTANIKGSYFTATSTTASSTLPLIEVTQLKIAALSGLLKATAGYITAAVAGTDYVAGGTGANTQVSYFTGTGAIAGDAGFVYDAANDRATLSYASTTGSSSGYASSTTAFFGALTLPNTTLGSVLFAGTSGLVTQDNTNFFWDDTNNRLGVGSTTPYAKMSVTNTGATPSLIVEDSTSPDTTPFIVDAAGNVGVGTSSPGHALTVFAGSAASTAATFPISLGASPGASSAALGMGVMNGLTGGLTAFQGYVRTTGGTNPFVFQPYGGFVGIGLQSTPAGGLVMGSQITSTSRFFATTVTTVGTPTVTPSASGGSMADGTYYYVITAVSNGGATERGTESAAATVVGGGGSGSVALSWSAPSGGGVDYYNIYRTTTSGTYGATTFVTSVAGTSHTDILNTTVTGTPATSNSAYLTKISSSGNSWFNGTSAKVGIGTTSPSSLLHGWASDTGTTITSASAAMLEVTNSNTTNNNFADLGFSTVNSSGARVVTGKVAMRFTNHTAGSEASNMLFLTMTGGASREALTILGANGFMGVGSTTPGSILSLGSSTQAINLNNTATSTFATGGGGINITSGCYAISGVCVGGSGGGISAIGPAGQTQTGSTITFASSTAAFNGLTPNLTITGAGNTITFTSSLAGTLGVGGGGTGATTFTNNRVLTGNGGSALVDEPNLTFDGTTLVLTGNQTVSGTMQITPLGTPAGAFLAVNPSGVIIATTSPAGGSGTPGGSATEIQYRAGASTFGAIANTAIDTVGLVGFGSTTPWAHFAIASSTISNYTRPLFAVATSSVFTGDLFRINATTTTQVAIGLTGAKSAIDIGVRIAIGAFENFYGMLLDQLNVNGRINTGEWFLVECAGSTFNGTQTSESTTPDCGGAWWWREDTTGQLIGSGSRANYFSIGIPAASTNDGSGFWYGGGASAFATAATSTPVMEGAVATMNSSNVFQLGTTTAYFGMVNVIQTSSAMEVPPTVGCYYTASSTISNWYAVCQTSAANVTQVDTGIASTTTNFIRFRIEMDNNEARFYYATPTTGMTKLTTMSGANYPSTSAVNPAVYMANTGADITRSLFVSYMRFWYRKTLWLPQ